MNSPHSILFFPIPALIGSIFLMRFVDVSRMVWLQQMILSATAFLICVMVFRFRKSTMTSKVRVSLLVVSLVLVFIPLLFPHGEAPHRWLNIGGLRLYIAACVLPMFLYLMSTISLRQEVAPIRFGFILMTMTLCLAAQPDASQATAFSVAALFSLWNSSLPKLFKSISSLVLLVCVIWAWMQLDPLQPVSYVEGVIQLAATAGVGMMILAIICVALFPLGLVWHGYKFNRPALFSVAIYYLLIAVFAYAQWTPMPLLGFGAGPIIGYFLMVFVDRSSVNTSINK